MKFTYLSVLAFVASALSQNALHPNGDSKNCLDVKDGRLANGSPLQVWPCTGGRNQQWELNWGGPSTIRLGNTGYCLDATINPVNGTLIRIWTCDSSAEQQWNTAVTTRGGIIKLANTNLCVDLNRGDHTPGTVVQSWECLDTDTNQIWTN